MRISTSLMYMNATRNINGTREKYLNAQEVLITQRRINRPSDDPIGAARALGVQKQISKFEQYQRNIDQAKTFVDQTEIALGSVREALMRVEELAVDVNGGAMGASEYQAVAKEVQNIFESILQTANTKVGNKYIFAGYQTTNQPFDPTGNYSGGVGDAIELEIADGSFLEINFDGQEVFKQPMDIFQAVADMAAAISSGDPTQITAQTPVIIDALDQIIKYSADIGAKTNRLESAETNNEELIVAYTSLMSQIEDADVVEASVDFSKTEQIYEATMEVSSRILSQSFLDFLR